MATRWRSGGTRANGGWRGKLVGLVATAHIPILPAWLGIALVFGLPEHKRVGERLLAFGLSVAALVLAAIATYAAIGGGAGGLRRYGRRQT